MPIARSPSAFARPFLKWAGGKTQLLPTFESLYPARPLRRYREPFLGGGAVFFHVQAALRPRECFLSDCNEELIETFTAVRDEVAAVIEHLRGHRAEHGRTPEAYYYAVRSQAAPATRAARAARLIYLNKTCFNGLHRVNKQGLFNVPLGRYTNPAILDEAALRQASAQLAPAWIETAPFSRVLDRAEAGDFIYFDPPYHPVSKTARFTAYARGAFGEDEQRELAEACATLHHRGCLVMVSNSDTPFIRNLYERLDRFTVRTVSARRSINARSEKRGPILEVVIMNYEPRGRLETDDAPSVGGLA